MLVLGIAQHVRRTIAALTSLAVLSACSLHSSASCNAWPCDKLFQFRTSQSECIGTEDHPLRQYRYCSQIAVLEGT
eukprot:2846281-Rhodomonas_salina.2